MQYSNMTRLTIPFWPLLLGLLIGATLGAALGYYGQCTSGMCPLTSTWWRGAIYGGVLGVLFTFSSAGNRRVDRGVSESGRQSPVISADAPQNSRTATGPK